jgi:hypothetical protein
MAALILYRYTYSPIRHYVLKQVSIAYGILHPSHNHKPTAGVLRLRITF